MSAGTWSKGIRGWLWRYYGEKVAKLRANGNVAAADALVRKYEIPADRIPVLESKGRRRGKAPRVVADEETPPPKREKMNKHVARRGNL